jgi:hypothetical protein
MVKTYIIINMENKDQLLERLKSVRGQDEYLTDELRKSLISTFFPNDTSELVAGLSNVTSAFYGFLLRDVANIVGLDKIDELSENLFYTLGKFKARQAVEKMNDIPNDTRALAMVIIFAVYTANPEYSFSIRKFSEDQTIIYLSGIDRYHRMSESLGITQYLSWPATYSFIQGINDEMQLNAKIDFELTPFDKDSSCGCLYHFTR